MEDSQGPRNKGLHYREAVLKYYRGFRKLGLNVDLVDMTCDISGYRILVVPMGYMFRNGFEEKVCDFVEKGGILAATYWTGIVDETDRCFLGGVPYGLMDVLGIRSTEMDALYDWEENSLVPVEGNPLGLTNTYTCKYLCDLVELRGAEAVMTYGSDFYEGYPAVTVNHYGNGSAWYVAADAEKKFQEEFLKQITKEAGISCGISEEIPEGLEVTTREKDGERYYIYQNFGTEPVRIPLPEGQIKAVYGKLEEELPVYGLAVVKVGGEKQ